MIKFLLNQTEYQLRDIDPNTTVLDYLREHLHFVGTKEGCASGDCGACTVVVGEPCDDKIYYKSINSCITPVGSLHGKQLITVEHLKQGKQLHPVQQAMVNCHGSQCGFCTPGFVMSMFAYRKNNVRPERQSVIEALGGNLCRCTGYKPIIEAAMQMYRSPLEDQFSLAESSVVEKLKAIRQQQATAELSAAGKTYFAPDNVAALADILLKYPQAKLVAGGTDLILDITQFLKEIEVLVSTSRVEELKLVEETESAIELGAAVTYIEARQALIAQYPDLHELIDRLGSRQIRNQGTIGGNVGNASPIGDMPPVLIALGASLVLRRGDESRQIPVEDYFIAYKKTALQDSEFIERIIVPKAKPEVQFRAYKISKRLEDDISASCGAFRLQLDDGLVKSIDIAFGGMAEIPKRATHCEQALIGQPWNDSTVRNAMIELEKDFTPLSDFRASADYRLKVSQNLLYRLYLELQSSAEQMRVTHYG
ncbi:MAG TPA: xanthine dehydrogenase small subunit [Gammaproteobacteria bacterium]|nr:xanthine dehydrogenase small subunit [Gammaproteobacteria bacterium]